MQASGFYRPAGLASYAHLARASAPVGQTNKLSTLVEEQLELSERDLWEDDAGVLCYPLVTLVEYKGTCTVLQGSLLICSQDSCSALLCLQMSQKMRAL